MDDLSQHDDILVSAYRAALLGKISIQPACE
jgi:hypothetical protein